jgi:hypothetical protein
MESKDYRDKLIALLSSEWEGRSDEMADKIIELNRHHAVAHDSLVAAYRYGAALIGPEGETS